MLMRRGDPSNARTRSGGVSVGSVGAAVAGAAGGRKGSYPDEWNWDKQGVVSEVRDQTLGGESNCSSCWAFAAAAALESRARRDGTDPGPDLSEQQLIDCVTAEAGYSSYGCSGGTAEDVLTYASSAFIASERSYPPYTARNGSRCQANLAAGGITLRSAPGYRVIAGNPEAIMDAVYNIGPVVAYVNVPADDSFFFYDPAAYRDGVYPSTAACTKLNSAGGYINHQWLLLAMFGLHIGC
ncbi:hypothetical protein ABPG75_012255 [Micractinium tetrahymenae]